jgi:hypothetical protein
MSADGIEKSKSTFVVVSIKAFSAAVSAGTAKLEVLEHKTRSQRDVYFLNCEIDGDKNRLYFALPKGANLDHFIDEKPKLIFRIEVDEAGVPKDAEMKAFEEDYREFMIAHVQPLIAAAAKFDKTMQIANFAKSDSATTKFCLLGLPRDIKTEQITRLIEAKGSNILLSVSYMYLLKDEEKGKAVYGASFEVGRYPYIDKKGKPPVAPKAGGGVGGKRRAAFVDDEESQETKKPTKEEEKLSLEKPKATEPAATIEI